MFVLRECRQIAAAEIGSSITEVTPSTELGESAGFVLAKLFEAAVGLLIREQIIDGVAESADATPSLNELKARDVASVAERVTCAAVQLMIANRLDVPVGDLSSNLNFALDLGADSLTRVDLVLLLEETLEVSVPDDSMFLLQTVGDAELFAVLFDRTREEVVLSLGEGARDLTFDTPLSNFGTEASVIALDAASCAVGRDVVLPDCPCQTLKDAVRLSFLAEKLCLAFAVAAGVEPSLVVGDTVPVRDLGLTSEQMGALVDDLTTSMDLSSTPIQSLHELSLTELVRTVAFLTGDDGGPS